MKPKEFWICGDCESTHDKPFDECDNCNEPFQYAIHVIEKATYDEATALIEGLEDCVLGQLEMGGVAFMRDALAKIESWRKRHGEGTSE